MQRSELKNSRLKARVEALSRELSRVEEEMQALSKAARHPEREAAARRLRRVTEEQEQARATQEARMPAETGFATRPEPASPAARDLRSEAGTGAPTGGDQTPRNLPDPRFANYFVTGGLQSVRPLRQERRVQRTRAIIMLSVAAILLYGVLRLLF